MRRKRRRLTPTAAAISLIGLPSEAMRSTSERSMNTSLLDIDLRRHAEQPEKTRQVFGLRLDLRSTGRPERPAVVDRAVAPVRSGVLHEGRVYRLQFHFSEDVSASRTHQLDAVVSRAPVLDSPIVAARLGAVFLPL